MKIKVDDRIAHLSSEEIENLKIRYYNFENIKNLIQEYNINISLSKLYSILPASVSENEMCPSCQSHMLIKKSSRSENTELKFCGSCGHVERSTCNCMFCKENRKRIELKKREEYELVMETKRRIIAEVYSVDEIGKIEYDKLSFKYRVYLGAMLRLSLDENMKIIRPLNSEKRRLSPTKDYTEKILNDLAINKIILVNPESPSYTFEEDGFPYNYDTSNVSYILNINCMEDSKQIINSIMNPTKINDVDKVEAYKLWQEIALNECIEYLYFQMDEINFNFHAGDKTIALFKDLLINFSVSQIFGIIYKSVANAAKYYLAKNNNISKKHAANSVTTNCQKYAEKALLNEWGLSKYRRSKDIPQSMISEFLFNRIMEIGDDGFNKHPYNPVLELNSKILNVNSAIDTLHEE